MPLNIDRGDLEQIFYHVFLPSKLPQQADKISDFPLLRSVVDAMRILHAILPRCLAVEHTMVALENLQAVNSLAGCAASESELSRRLLKLEDGQAVPVYCKSQNAAIMITKRERKLVFEGFELSPNNQAVVGTKGRLTRTFPAFAVVVDLDSVDQADLLPAISNMLSTMCQQPVAEMQPQSRKARGDHDEIRDTAHPAIISELFFGFLTGFGDVVSVSAISKNTREEVFWKDAETPWRRSPVWLLIRVVLQLILTRSEDGSRMLYKEAMAFITSQYLEASLGQDFCLGDIYSMTAKIGRRLCKMDNMVLRGAVAAHDLVITHSRSTVESASRFLSDRWEDIQRRHARELDFAGLANLKFGPDTFLHLPSLDKYIERMHSHTEDPGKVSFSPSSDLVKHDADILPRLPDLCRGTGCYTTANLHEFEQWVGRNLKRWTEHNAEEGSCKKLYDLMVAYHEFAGLHYHKNPEAISVMLLTMLEIWVACDKIATAIEPRLSDYNPEIPSGALESLLLPFYSDMERLILVERHVQQREEHSQLRQANMLFHMKSAEGFASRYFRQSETHQSLLSKITEQAEAARAAKRLELEHKKDEYRRLNSLYSERSCEFTTVVTDSWMNPPETIQKHRPDCMKCSYRLQRDALEISVHEWPLPQDPLEAEVVIFELDVPSWLAYWRDARSYLLQDVLRGERGVDCSQPGYRLSITDPHLSSTYFRGTRGHRIDLLSESKPFTVSHYRSKKVDGNLHASDVCVPSGLHYQYYDVGSHTYVGHLDFSSTVAESCTYKLSSQQLQRYIFRPCSSPDGPPPNCVIASQDSCPENMSLEEYKELASVPLGHHIQWANIILQLVMPGVDFRKEDTTLVFLQCIYQSGPPDGSVLRESHRIFLDDAKVSSLIDHTETAISRVKQNWESAQALRLFVAVLTRSLSLNHTIVSRCLGLLAQVREIALKWMDHLRDRAHAAIDHQERTDFIRHSVDVAMICTSTFDVDGTHMASAIGSDAAVSAMVQCSIIVQQGRYAVMHEGSGQSPLLRHQRTIQHSHGMLIEYQGGLDDAARKSWSAYTPGCGGWTAVSEDARNWLTTKTATGLVVHYNALDGEFLVNGLPLDQAPSHYRDQELYSTLFGRAIVEVMPPSSPGFQFSTKRRFEGYEVQLGMRDSESNAADRLIVRTSGGCGIDDANSTFETIPKNLFTNVYPEAFVDDFVHWYNHESGDIEFRPRVSPWISDRMANRKLVKDERSQAWQLSRGRDAILGSQKVTSIAVTGVLDPLMTRTRIHCTLRSSTKELTIDIPSLHLTFHLSEGTSNLRSKEYRNMLVDRVQSMGTLVSFRNKLLLRSETGRRLLLIKEAALSYNRNHDHVAVATNDQSPAAVHALRIDNQLGRLVDNGNLQCKLYLAYLHALTSFCLPDPFLSMTGTEHALTILRSAAVQSFRQLSQSNVDTLGDIARLSPCRRFYPLHLQVMQTVSWNHPLHFLAQPAEFRMEVDRIFQQAKNVAFFHASAMLRYPSLPQLDYHLQNRSIVRESCFKVPGFGAESHSIEYDKEYNSRDQDNGSERAVRAASMSRLLYRHGDDKHWEIATAEQLWDKTSTLLAIENVESCVSDGPLRYDSIYFSDEIDSILTRLPSIRSSLIKSRLPGERHSAVIGWFTGIVFALCDTDCRILQTFAVFLKCQRVANIPFPPAMKFRPREGKHCSMAKLRRVVQDSIWGLKRCPENNLPRARNERHDAYHQRRTQAWQSASNSAVDAFVQTLDCQWPCEEPVFHLNSSASTYINVENAIRNVRAQFKAWYDNRLLYGYLENVVREIENLKTRRIDMVDFLPVKALQPPSVCGYIQISQMFSTKAPEPNACEGAGEFKNLQKEAKSGYLQKCRLQSLIKTLGCSDNKTRYWRRYIEDLQTSLQALQMLCSESPTARSMKLDGMEQQKQHHKVHVAGLYDLMITSMTDSQGASYSICQWPRLSPVLLLQQLSHSCWNDLPESWKRAIVGYGVAIVALQKADRLVEFVRESNQDGIMQELRNVGHTNWSPYEHPEWLLMEVESGIVIRDIQANIARQMQQPDCSQNAVMQLNMGEGKSSVIAPMVAAALADGSRLVRVIVAKPQSKQMAQMLLSKLGGLVNRRIYHLPFSRDLRLDEGAAKTVDNTLRECMANQGILLVQPEHILSFKLMGPECYISEKERIGRQLVAIQDFLDEYSRDIVDESDENFSVRFELIYTMGLQNPIEMSPDRWYLVQQVLEILKRIAPNAVERQPDSFEIHPAHQGGFSRIRILRLDAGIALVKSIAKEICEGGLSKLQIARQPAKIRDAVYTYITKFELSEREINTVEGGEFWSDTTKAPLLLLRGILAGGVMTFALSQKRWRVNYGLASRTPPTRLAVPYRAKDSPSLRSEFSHPDVVILLTSLCYYYQGLNDEDLFSAFAHLLDSDQAEVEYQSFFLNHTVFEAV